MAGGGASSQHCSDGRERCNSQRCCGTGRQRTAACSVLAALLQQRAGRRNVAAMASNALDVTTLLRWPAMRWTSRCVAAMSGSALGLGALLQCSTALQLRPTLFFFFFFYPTTWREKKNGEREKFWHLLSSVPTLFVPALVSCNKRKALS